MSKMTSRDEMLNLVRKKRIERQASRRDPDQFKPPKPVGNEKNVYYFRVLPELHQGDKCSDGICDIDNELWYYENAAHWVHNRERYECPRSHDGEDCPMCNLGFELLNATDDDEIKARIKKKYMPSRNYAANIYFLDMKSNPEDLRGKVKWYNMPFKVWEKMDECIGSDDSGDEIDPKACGIFYHPYEGGYTFKLVVKKQGIWPDYSESSFLAKSLSPLVITEDGTASDGAIEEILTKRIVVQKKFTARSLDKLKAAIKKMEDGDEAVDAEAGVEDVPLDDEQAEKPKIEQKPVQQTKPAAQQKQTVAAAKPVAPKVEEEAKPQVKTTPSAKIEQPPKVEQSKATQPSPDPAEDQELAELLGAIRSKQKK
jgi:hypothetical protein